jgi:hypothetical protein
MKIHLASSVLVLVIAALCGAASAEGKKLVVVVGKGSPMTSISRGDLRRCFLGDRISLAGRILSPFNAATATPERVAFDKAVLGMSPGQVGRFWMDRKIRGQGSAPRSLPSPAQIAKVVAKVPGAIGYLTADQMTADVQPILVDGLPYTDAHYDLAMP